MLAAGSRIGSYEVLAPLGAGGMGEVYRARDPRIGRDVAIKVLPAEVVRDRDRLARFQQEAQAAGILNHPNLLTIHELGLDGEHPYIVSELLEGMTLRERLSSGAIPPRKATEYAQQIAEGLAAAHEHGIIHRDLKPENIFITKDGRVKILDFGLAKLRPAMSEVRGDEATVQQKTNPGTVLGSVGYMSPEQVRGESVDARSDIFAVGVILYEMLTGRRAFKAPSSVETMNAILNSDPPEIGNIAPPLQRIVAHCLEKNPEERFQSARDLAFDLESLSDTTSAGRAIPAKTRKPLSLPLSAATAVAIIAIAGAFIIGKRVGHTSPPHFHRLTYRYAFISGARFAPDGQSIIYSCASGGGGGQELWVGRLDSPESRSLGTGPAQLLSISKNGEAAVLLNPLFGSSFRWNGTLARFPLAGGAPREVATDIQDADWNPSGDDLAIIRTVAGTARIEFPLGTIRYQTAGWLSHLRVSPDGKEIAYVEHPVVGDDKGAVALLRSDGKRAVLSQTYNSMQGLVWTPDGNEVWFTASNGNLRELHAVNHGGKERRVFSTPNNLTIDDISRDGRPLITASNTRVRLVALPPGATEQAEYGWLDWSLARDISPDGKLILFDETGEGGGSSYSVYVRRTDGSPAVRLGEGTASGFSPDGRRALALQRRFDPPRVALYPLGAGVSRVIVTRQVIERAAWMPDGGRVMLVGHEPNHGSRVYILNLLGGEPQAITPEGFLGSLVSPDGRYVLVMGPDAKRYLYPIAGGTPEPLKEMPAGIALSSWTRDGKSLLWYRRFESPIRVMKFDIKTGRSELWKEIPTPQSDLGISALLFSADGKSYAYSAYGDPGDVFVLESAR